jgi:hypothetical protein
MATVLRLEGFRFWIWSNDHEPPHVHAENGTGEISILIGNEQESPVIDKNTMRNRDAKRAWRIVAERQEYFLEEWEKIHGKVEV